MIIRGNQLLIWENVMTKKQITMVIRQFSEVVNILKSNKCISLKELEGKLKGKISKSRICSIIYRLDEIGKITIDNDDMFSWIGQEL